MTYLVDVITVALLVMAVGLTVDYTMHIAHAQPVDESNKNETIEIAIIDMGGVAKGAFTTFLGILTLAFSQTTWQ